MATYPAGIYAPRTKANKPGVVYTPANTTQLYAEDVSKDDAEVVAIETELGTNPKGAHADVKARLVADESAIAAKPDSFLELSDAPASYSGQAGKVAAVNTEEDALEFIEPGGGGSSTVVQTLIDPQVNISSVGDTYTDVSGNTFAETANQTRLTMSAARIIQVTMYLSGHVNAGTGTFELYNFSDSASLGTKTTTSTVEATVSGFTNSIVATNNGDDITIRVKNSGAGNTITIDSGGMICAEKILAQSPGPGSDLVPVGGGYISAIKFCLAKAKSTTTCTGQLAYIVSSISVSSAAAPGKYDYVGATWDQTVNGTVFARTPTRKIPHSTSAMIIEWSAVGNNLFYGFNLEITADDI